MPAGQDPPVSSVRLVAPLRPVAPRRPV